MSAPHWRQALRERAGQVRNEALGPLAERLGYRRDPRRSARWRGDGSVLSIRGSQFFDHARGQGGGGAIDLVMHARGCSFRQAVEFLADGPPAAPVAAPAERRPPALRLPAPVAAHWPPVREFLVEARGLAPALVEACRRAGALYADRRRNAVFPCRDRSGALHGAELVGTRPARDGSTFKGLAPGSRRQRGGFWLTSGPVPPSAALLVESAVDALSVLQLPAPDLPAPGLPPNCLLASTAGAARRLPRWLGPFPDSGLLCGYDADQAGDQAACALQRLHPALRRLRPSRAKDWNELLRSRQ